MKKTVQRGISVFTTLVLLASFVPLGVMAESQISSDENNNIKSYAISAEYEYVDIADGVRITNYVGTDEEVVIPETLDGKKVLEIGDEAFYDNRICTNITVPDSVTSIGSMTFRYCSNLKNITIPDSVTEIGYAAFSYCSRLTNVTIPDSLTSIEYSAFSYCSSLSSIYIPGSVKSIGYAAFSYCNNLAQVNLSDSVVTNIDSYAFSYCRSLKTISIPDSVTDVGYGAFIGCSELDSIQFNSAFTGIGDAIPTTTTIVGYEPSTAKDYADTNGNPFELIGGSETDENSTDDESTSGSGIISFLVKDVYGNYLEYDSDLLNLSYLVYQINPTDSRADMYRHFKAVTDNGGNVIGVKNSQSEYIDYNAMISAYLVAQLSGTSFDVDAYLVSNKAVMLSETVTNVQVIDADGNGASSSAYQITFYPTVYLGMKNVVVILNVSNPSAYSVSYGGVALTYQSAVGGFVAEISKNSSETLKPVIIKN